MSKDTERDELRARFTVYISQVISHAKLDHIRQLKRRAQEIYLEDLEMEPSVAVSYTHLDVYKRQQCIPSRNSRG